MEHFFKRSRANSTLASSVPIAYAQPDQHVSLHSTSIDMPGTNNSQNKGSNYTESLEVQQRIRLDDKDD